MTDTTPTTELTIMKTDKLGRIQTTAQDRETWLDAFEQSGMSGAAFARLHGISYTTFAGWRQRRRRERTSETAEPLFDEVDIRPVHSDTVGLKVSLPGGASVNVDRADQFPLVAALLNYLEHAC